MKKKIGIMGGTFNPIHNGHLLIAKRAYENIGLDKVLFMPSGNSYMKENVLETNHRVSMVSLAIESYPYFELSTFETDRSGNTYTYETLELLNKQNVDTQYYFIMGADSLYGIQQWRNPDIIFKLCTLVCTIRDSYDIEDIRRKGNELSKFGANIIYLDIPRIDISSTVIREHVNNKLSIDSFVPKKVAEYIMQEQLYEEKN